MSESGNVQKKPTWNLRGLTSLVVTLAFIVTAVTGVILYVSPQGRVANWTGWNVLGLSKEQWSGVHTTSSLLFVLASVFHVYFNWRTLIHYLLLKRRLHLKREIVCSIAVVTAVFAGTFLNLPPFSSVVQLNDRIKAYWESQSAQAPYAHAEASTLAEFSEMTGISIEILEKRFATAGIKLDGPASQTIGELARIHDLSPKDLFSKTSDRRGLKGYGMGIGRQTLESLCESTSIPLERAVDVLQQKGFTAEAGSTLKYLSEQKGISPAEVKELIIEKNKQ